jgi:phosphopantetheinyl transferase
MLFVQKNIEPEGKIGIWKIAEDASFFLENLDLTAVERAQLSELAPKKRLEWLAARYLLHLMSEREVRSAVLKDEFGKPFLENSKWYISFSHSHELAAVIAAPFPVGIDIQFIVPKIERIAHKFMRPEELASLDETHRTEHLHAYWGAKEALYKIYGRRQLDFREHIFIGTFDVNDAGTPFFGKVVKGDYDQKFALQFERMGDYLLVWGRGG